MTLRITFLFFALSTLAVTHFFAIKFSIYWHYLWFDIPMHILGGLCVAFGVSILPFFRLYLPKRWNTLLGYLALVFLVGVVWEVFEYVAGISVAVGEDLVSDTTIDFIMDLIGGAIGYFIMKHLAKLDS